MLKSIYRVHPPGRTGSETTAAPLVQHQLPVRNDCQLKAQKHQTHSIHYRPSPTSDTRFYQQQFRRTRFQNVSHHFQQVRLIKIKKEAYKLYYYTYLQQERFHGAAEAGHRSSDQTKIINITQQENSHTGTENTQTANAKRLH